MSLTVLCAWFALWLVVLVGGDLLKPTGAVQEAAGVNFGTRTEVPGCYEMVLRAHTQGAWPGVVRVWRQTRAVLPFLPEEAVLGLPEGE